MINLVAYGGFERVIEATLVVGNFLFYYTPLMQVYDLFDVYQYEFSSFIFRNQNILWIYSNSKYVRNV